MQNLNKVTNHVLAQMTSITAVSCRQACGLVYGWSQLPVLPVILCLGI